MNKGMTKSKESSNGMQKTRKNKQRCAWVENEQIYIDYHDKEWGVPVGLGSFTTKLPAKETSLADTKQFEFLTLESAQAGLSWITILKRREGYRRVFKDFNPNKVAKFTENDINKALQDEGIIRNKLKVRAAVKNAQVFLDIQKEFGSFSEYIWGFVNGKPVVNHPKSVEKVPATSEVSDAVSKDLKKRGMSFVGSTIIYAHLQATGLINDHSVECWKS